MKKCPISDESGLHDVKPYDKAACHNCRQPLTAEEAREVMVERERIACDAHLASKYSYVADTFRMGFQAGWLAAKGLS